MSTAAQLNHDIRGLEATHDALVREIDRKYGELDQIAAEIKLESDRLDKIRAEIANVKAHFGV
jgi:hypothetical protein